MTISTQLEKPYNPHMTGATAVGEMRRSFHKLWRSNFLLHHSIVNKTGEHFKLINHCLKAMARGGMYDVVGGGFSRYSTDNLWRVPHFEKMLYDNALLVRAYLHAWQVTKDPAYKRIVEETLNFVSREMTHEKGGFFSSLDADSEGVEGKFYVWSLNEIREVLKDESVFFEVAYGIIADGNWEGKTVLHREMDDATLAARFRLNLEDVPTKLAKSHSKLLTARSKRIRPGTDDKVLTSWNGLMLAAFAEAARVLASSNPQRNNYLDLATRSAEFLLSELRPNGTTPPRMARWKNYKRGFSRRLRRADPRPARTVSNGFQQQVVHICQGARR